MFLSKKAGKIIIYVIAAVLLFAAGSGVTYLIMSGSRESTVLSASSNKSAGTGSDSVKIQKYDDIRKFNGSLTEGGNISSFDLSKAEGLVETLWFNQKTVWPEKSKMPADCNPEKILEDAKNPGLGVRELHKQGITGKGVNVAIIDQPLFDDHPEFTGKIAAYKDFDCKSEGSMHGPAVASLLAGNSIGTAPGAKLYYAAAPSWLADAGYYARALDWIVEENEKLSAGEKIRAVSISAAPSGEGSPFTKNNELWDRAVKRAEDAGILILDCTANHGIIGSCYLASGSAEEPSSYKPGYPGASVGSTPDRILVPTSPRTTAEEYVKGDVGYQYTGRGGLSWAIPYCTGVLAMGWQINPDLASGEIVDLLFKSAYKSEGTLIINPTEFIKLVKESK